MVQCAICGHTVEPDEPHMEILTTYRGPESPTHVHDYFMHRTCAKHSIGNWQEP